MPAAKPCEHGGPLLVLANVAVLNGDHDRAQQLYDESIEVHRRAGETWGLGILLLAAAGMRIVREDYEQARRQASEALSLCQELEDPRGIAWSLEVFAGLLAAEGHADGAARLWGASEACERASAPRCRRNSTMLRDRYIESVKTSFGEARFAMACAEGRAMPLADAVALARQQALQLP